MNKMNVADWGDDKTCVSFQFALLIICNDTWLNS